MLDGLRQQLRLLDDAGQPLVLVVGKPLEPASARLMASLGVTVEVRPVSAAKVNDRVRVAAGEGGTIVVLGAWCGQCKEEVGPINERCPWCRTVILDEDTLSASEMRAQITDGSATARVVAEDEARRKVRPVEESQAPEEPDSSGDNSGDVVEEPASTGDSVEATAATVEAEADVDGTTKRSGTPSAWTAEQIVAVIRAHAAEHGTPPTNNAWLKATAEHPSGSTVYRIFGSWASAIEAAGFPRPTRGGSHPKVQGQESEVAPNGGRTGHGVARWDRESAILAVTAYVAANGKPPRQQDAVGNPHLPNSSLVRTLGMSWADLIEAAGYERPTRGRQGPMTAEHRDAIREGMSRMNDEPPVVTEAIAKWHVVVKGTGLRYRNSLEAYAAAEEIEADGERVAEDARFDGHEQKAEQAIDASRELAAAVRTAARMAERRESPQVSEGEPLEPAELEVPAAPLELAASPEPGSFDPEPGSPSENMPALSEPAVPPSTAPPAGRAREALGGGSLNATTDEAPAFSLALTGDFTGDAQRVRHEAARLRQQADALDTIADGIDQLEAA